MRGSFARAIAVAIGSFPALSCAPNAEPKGDGASGGVVAAGGSTSVGASGAATMVGGSETRGGAASGSGSSGNSSTSGTSAGGSLSGGVSGGAQTTASGGAAAGSGGSSLAEGGSLNTGGGSVGGVTNTGNGGSGGGGSTSTGGGGSTSTGGVAGSSTAGGGGNIGSGGANGGRPATSGGVAGAASDDRAAAQVLDGFAILKPCVSSFKPSGNASNSGDCCCEELAANENQHISKQFGGDPNVTYNVKVRIAGVAERYWYSGGVLDTVSKLFYTGGLPTIHGTQAPNNNLRPGQGACKVHPPDTDGQFALGFTVPAEIKPTDGCYNGFNVFALTVSAPKQSYYLNYTTDFDGVDRQPHSVYKTDYTVTIPITGQAKVDFYTIDGDHHQVTNNGTMSVSNVKTAQPYNGNFLEFTVLEVTRTN